jgi:hypothetical protein
LTTALTKYIQDRHIPIISSLPEFIKFLALVIVTGTAEHISKIKHGDNNQLARGDIE